MVPGSEPLRGARWPLVLGAIVLAGVLSAVGLQLASRSLLVNQERSASQALKDVVAAELDFRSNDRDGNKINDFWVGDVSGLHYMKGPGGELIRLIRKSVADADAEPLFAARREPLDGYWFVAFRRNPYGQPYEASDKPSKHRSFAEFAFCAYPVSTGSGRQSSYVVNEDCTVGKAPDDRIYIRWPVEYPAPSPTWGFEKLD